jgi:hypothetical protein
LKKMWPLQKPAGCTRSETARAGEQMGKVESRAMEIGRPGTTRMLRRSGRASSFLPPTHQLAGRRSGQAILTDNCQSIMLRQDPCLFCREKGQSIVLFFRVQILTMVLSAHVNSIVVGMPWRCWL